MTAPNNINYDNLTMGDKVTLGSGASFVNIKYNGNMCLLQLPKTTCFGVDCFDDGKDKKHTMAIQFKKEEIEADSKTKEAIEGLKKFEEHIKSWIKESSQDLFKKKTVSKDYVEAIFNPLLKESKNKETEEADGRYYTMKIKLKPSKKQENKFDFGSFSSKKEKLDITLDNVCDTIKKWGQVKTVISPNIWIISGKIGVSWNMWQLKYWEPVGGPALNKEDVCMIESSDDEEEADEEAEEDGPVMSDSDSD